ncbi:fungal trichothecene efflux pump [Diplodia corticola]|uniref:Fungal trichothecene efflux pump n=1 Tax=Diplodia corticola TaxID=236234 RepID=A0A1J9SLV3_9PEZI|nr:fungal trichothecene efflux pump [Diplodia corticola]OJD40700.1 fungal trichothecene efflux pump [Diplodia corticola]
MSAPTKIEDSQNIPMTADKKRPQEHVVDAETSSNERNVHIQHGVKRVEAINQARSMKALVITAISHVRSPIQEDSTGLT